MIKNDYCHKVWKCPICNVTNTYYSIRGYRMAVARNMCDLCYYKRQGNLPIIKKKK